MNRVHLEQNRAALVQTESSILAKLRDDANLTPEDRTKLWGEADTAKAQIEEIDAKLAEQAKLEARLKANSGSTRVTTHDNAEDKPWRNGGEFLKAVANADQGNTDPRLRKLAAGNQESISTDGGFLVATDFSTEIMQRVYDVGLVAGRCKEIPISAQSNGIKIPAIDESSRVDGSRYGGVLAFWTAESASIAATKPTFRKVELELKKLAALTYATDELLADEVALDSFLASTVSQELAFKLDDAIINGDGVGKPFGILSAPALVTQAKESGQANTTVNFANVAKMYGRMPARNVANAVWYANQDVIQQLVTLKSSEATGSAFPLLLPGQLANQSPFYTLFGRPIIPIEQAATLGAVGDLIFADMSQYLLAKKGGIQAAQSMHVRFITDEMAFRFTMRVDGKPWWNTALTPFKGSNTLSPFIALQAR